MLDWSMRRVPGRLAGSAAAFRRSALPGDAESVRAIFFSPWRFVVGSAARTWSAQRTLQGASKREWLSQPPAPRIRPPNATRTGRGARGAAGINHRRATVSSVDVPLERITVCRNQLVCDFFLTYQISSVDSSEFAGRLDCDSAEGRRSPSQSNTFRPLFVTNLKPHHASLRFSSGSLVRFACVSVSPRRSRSTDSVRRLDFAGGSPRS
jgi:hypothetical protein